MRTQWSRDVENKLIWYMVQVRIAALFATYPPPKKRRSILFWRNR